MIFLLISIGLFVVILSFFYQKLNENHKSIVFESENYFLNPQTRKLEPFPKWTAKSTIYLSVIIPAYNEQDRLPKMLEECLPYLQEHYPNNYEVIIVNDGSHDQTNLSAIDFVAKSGCDCVRLLTLERNRGKGGAVKMGMERARGSLLLFADADGATKFSELAQLETEILQPEFDSNSQTRFDHSQRIAQLKRIVIGSRAHLEEQSKSERSLFRTFLMHGFHLLVNVLVTGNDIRDTQCGFKMFTRHTAAACFANLHIQRWAFDVELFYIAKQMKFNIKEVAVHWTEIDGSKITPVISWIQMGVDLLLIWAKYFFGFWRIDRKHF